jgi:ElaB/YqjD/DUF883 family membrane-anchored ribosome-binding protein
MANAPSSSDFSPGPPSFNDKLSSAATEAKSKAADLGRKAADTVDQARPATAAGLSAAAGSIDDNADQATHLAQRAAHRTAHALSASAEYIRDNSVREMMDDAMAVVKNNPGAALLGAAAIGFIVGRAFSSRS